MAGKPSWWRQIILQKCFSKINKEMSNVVCVKWDNHRKQIMWCFQESWVSCGSGGWKSEQQQISEEIQNVYSPKENWLNFSAQRNRLEPTAVVKHCYETGEKNISNANGWMPVNVKSVGNYKDTVVMVKQISKEERRSKYVWESR